MAESYFLVGTPIGNLEDMTYRAIRILKEVDVIAAEDTRNTIKLCNYFEIKTPLISYHEHNLEVGGEKIIEYAIERENQLRLSAMRECLVFRIQEQILLVKRIEQDLMLFQFLARMLRLVHLVASGLNSTTILCFLVFYHAIKKNDVTQIEKLKKREETIIVI